MINMSSLRKTRAREFAIEHHMPIEKWMLSKIWHSYIGCMECSPYSECWGKAKCHGVQNGCGCVYCHEFKQMVRIANGS